MYVCERSSYRDEMEESVNVICECPNAWHKTMSNSFISAAVFFDASREPLKILSLPFLSDSWHFLPDRGWKWTRSSRACRMREIFLWYQKSAKLITLENWNAWLPKLYEWKEMLQKLNQFCQMEKELRRLSRKRLMSKQKRASSKDMNTTMSACFLSFPPHGASFYHHHHFLKRKKSPL